MARPPEAQVVIRIGDLKETVDLILALREVQEGLREGRTQPDAGADQIEKALDAWENAQL